MKRAAQRVGFLVIAFFVVGIFCFSPSYASATTIFSDNFSNDYGELSTHTPTTAGTSWSLLINNGVLLYNQSYNNHVTVQSNTANAGSFYTAEGAYGSADYEISSTINFSSGDSNYTRTMAVRVQDANNMYFLRYGGNSLFTLYKRVAGTITPLGSASISLQGNLTSPYIGDSISLGVLGSTITAKVNGVTKIEVTDSSITAIGKAGIGLGYVTVSTDDGGTGVGIDNVVVETLTADSTAPTITNVSSDKVNGSYTIGEAIDIDITFSEAVTSTGNVTVTLETGATDRTCTFTVSNATTGTCNYTVQAGDASADLTVSSISGTIADQASNAMTDFSPATNLAANKALVIDTADPTVDTLSPSDGATVVSVTTNFVLTFDAVVNRQTGNITIKKSSDDSIAETIDVTSAQVTGTGTAIITVNPSVTLESETGYYVEVATTAFDDIAGNSYAGIADTTTWNFTTADVANPTVTTFSPADNASDVAIASNLVITFDEAVDVETGNITIKKASDDSIAETIGVTSGQVTGAGTTIITVNPTSTLEYGTGYYVQVDATVFDDPSGNGYAGINGATTWNFTTIAEPEESDERLEVYDVEYSVTETTIDIKWKTNNDADSAVRYGTDRDLKKKKSEDNDVKKHEMTIKNLSPDTLYYFRVKSEDDDGNEDQSRIYSAVTRARTSSLLASASFPQVTDELPHYQNLSVIVNDAPVGNKEVLTDSTTIAFDPEKTQEEIKKKTEKIFATEVFRKDDRQYIKEVKFQILGNDDQPLANLPVTLHSEPRIGVTNEEGIVTFSDVPTGEHRLIFAYAGESIEKGVLIGDLKQSNGPVKAEVIVITAKRDPLPMWVYALISTLTLGLAMALVFLYRKKRENKSLSMGVAR